MKNLPAYYTRLFDGVTDALEALKEQNYGTAQALLIKAQQDAEELFIQQEEE